MARPQKRKAAKDYPDAGIQKGDEYWYVQIKTGPRSSRVMRQKNPFRRSQLTSSAFLSTIYDLEDSLKEVSDVEGAREIATALRELGEETQSSFDNMPEGLQQGDTGQMLEQRAEGCENAADEIEGLCDEYDDVEPESKEDLDEDDERDESDLEQEAADKRDDILDQIRDVQIEY